MNTAPHYDNKKKISETKGNRYLAHNSNDHFSFYSEARSDHTERRSVITGCVCDPLTRAVQHRGK